MSRKLFVGNLPYETMENDLETLFAQAGTVETVTVMRDRMTGRARGFAFVEMASDDDAQKAISDFLSGESTNRQQAATLLFAGLYETLNRQRNEVMTGIERFTRKHRELADKVRSDILALRKVQDEPQADQGKIDELTKPGQ